MPAALCHDRHGTANQGGDRWFFNYNIVPINACELRRYRRRIGRWGLAEQTAEGLAEGVVESAAVGEEDADDREQKSDAGGCCLRLGDGGLGWFGCLHRLVHGNFSNNIC